VWDSHPATAFAIDGGAIIVPHAKPSRCPKIARKEPVRPAQPSYCYPLNKEDVERLDRTLTRRFEAPTRFHKLVIDYGCDTIPYAFDRIDFEQGWAHGGPFELYRLTRTSWPSVAVRAVRFACNPNCGAQYARTEIDGRKIEGALSFVRTAILARMHDVELFQPGYFSPLAASSAWVDYHLSLEIRSGENVIGRRWTDPPGMDGQEARIPLEVASEPISNALKSVKFESGIATQADRELFATRFAAAFDGGTPKNSWLLGLLLVLAEELGTIEQLPFILPLLEPRDGDFVTRDRAIDAVAALTTLDLRKDEAGNERPRAEVAADYLRECRD
jgi:hypothetical protein